MKRLARLSEGHPVTAKAPQRDPWRIDPPPEFRVCLACTWIYGPWKNGGVTRIQRCDCRKPDGGEDETWPRYDYNLFSELCRCCGRVFGKSGHCFSVWFCGACRLRVTEFDRKHGAPMIPIGRHTIMAGIGLRKDEEDVDDAAKRIHGEMRSLFGAMSHLERWRDRDFPRGVT
jgi:hypothetical protein